MYYIYCKNRACKFANLGLYIYQTINLTAVCLLSGSCSQKACTDSRLSMYIMHTFSVHMSMHMYMCSCLTCRVDSYVTSLLISVFPADSKACMHKQWRLWQGRLFACNVLHVFLADPRLQCNSLHSLSVRAHSGSHYYSKEWQQLRYCILFIDASELVCVKCVLVVS